MTRRGPLWLCVDDGQAGCMKTFCAKIMKPFKSVVLKGLEDLQGGTRRGLPYVFLHKNIFTAVVFTCRVLLINS